MVTLVKRSKKKEKHKKNKENLLKAMLEIENQRLDAGSRVLIGLILALSWKLRKDEGYSQKRLTKFINELFEVYSDVNIGGLLTFDDIEEQILKETGLDVFGLILEHADKHKTRVDQKRKEVKQC